MYNDNNVPKKFWYSHYNFLQEVGIYWLNPNIANQVWIYERKTNPSSSPSGLTVSALTNDSSSTPTTTKHCQYFTDDSLSATGSYPVWLFDQILHLPDNKF